MDRKYIEEHHVVARYLADRLSDAEREAFEAFYLEHPDIVQDMEAVARLKVGLARLQETGDLAQSIAAPRFPRYYSFAAAAAIIVAALGLLYLREPPQRTMLAASAATLLDRSGAPLRAGTPIYVLRTRSSAAYDAEITVGDSPQAIELRVLPEVEVQPPRYRVELSTAAAGSKPQVLAAVGNLLPGADGFVPVFLDASSLASGTYILALTGETAASTSSARSEFVIHVKR